LARYSDGLKRLAEIGMELAEDLRTEARARAAEAQLRLQKVEAGELPPSPAEPQGKHQADLALTFARVSRCVRLSFMLDDKFHADFAARLKAGAADAKAAASERRQRDQDTIKRVVRETIHSESGDESEYEHLLGQMRLRLDRDDIELDLGLVPVDVLIARVCRDLGVEYDRDQWQGADWLGGDDADGTPVSRESCPICGAAAARPPEPDLSDPDPPEPELDPPDPASAAPTAASRDPP
jgi:rubrerythrin